MTISQMKTD